MEHSVTSFENEFYEWLSKKVEPAQLSSYYDVFNFVNKYCLQRGILKQPLFETGDIESLKRVKRTVESINTRYGSQMSKGMQLYMNFMSENDRQRAKSSLPISTGQQVSVSVTQKKPQESSLTKNSSERESDQVRLKRREMIRWMVERGHSSGDIIASLSDLKEYEGKAKKSGGLNKSIFLVSLVLELELIAFFTGKEITSPYLQSLQLFREYLEKDKTSEKRTIITTGNVETASLDKPASQVTKAGKDRVAEPEKKEQIKAEYDELLSAETFLPLREALSKNGIITMAELKSIKLWPFMNQHDLYSIAERQNVYRRVQSLLYPDKENDEAKRFRISYEGDSFKGETLAEAYLQFCKKMAARFPLRIRSLLGKVIPGTSIVALYGECDGDGFLRMVNPIAYVPSVLSKDDALRMVTWLGSACGIKIVDLNIGEPKSIELVKSTEAMSLENSRESLEASSEEKSEVLIEERPEEHSDALVEESTEEQPKVAFEVYSEMTSDAVSEEHQKQHQLHDQPSVSEQYAQSVKPRSFREQRAIDMLCDNVLKADLDGITYETLRDRIYKTMLETRRMVGLANQIIEIRGRLYHEEALIDWNDGAEQLDSVIEKLMQKNNGYVSSAQLYEYARSEMNMFLNDNDFNDERTVYEMAKHLFEKNSYHGKRYLFTGKSHIYASNDVTSTFDLCSRYAEDQGGVIAKDELIEYLHSIGIKTGNIWTQIRLYDDPYFLYYDEGQLILSKSMEMDAEWKLTVSSALQRLFADVGDHIVIRDIQPFWFEQLPTLPGGRSWTPLLLQSVLRFYGEELGARTIIALDSQGLETLHTMLVKNESPIQNFGDVVIAHLLDSEIEQRCFEGEALRELLVKAGMIQGNELLNNMPKALSKDERFSWDVAGKRVTIRV